MWWRVAIIYAVIAITALLFMMIMLGRAVNEADEGEQYPESFAQKILMISVFFIVSFIMAIMWPICPVVLAGVFLCEKIEEVKSNANERNCREGKEDHICK